MLQQVSQLAPPAPQDRGPATGDAMASGGVSQAGGGDFLAMLAQAEAQEGVAPSVVIAPAEMSSEDGTLGQPAGGMAGFVPAIPVQSRQDDAMERAGHEGVALPDGLRLAGGRPGEGSVGRINGALPGPVHVVSQGASSPPATAMPQAASASQPMPGALPLDQDAAPQAAPSLAATAMPQAASASQPMPGALPSDQDATPQAAPSLAATAMPQAASASPLALSGTGQPAVTVAQPAITPPTLLPQEEAPQSDVSPAAAGFLAMDRNQAPATGIGLAAKVPPGDLPGHDWPAEAWASDLHPEAGDHASPRDPADEAPPAFAVRSEAYPAQSTGPAPTSMVGPLLPEGRGLSMPADLPMTALGSLPGQLGTAPFSPAAAAGLALPYQRLHQPQLAAQVAPAVLAMGVSPGADGGPGRLTVAIRPAELGTLQIIADKTDDKTARIAVLAERPETLQLLVRDASTLEAALRAAGVGEGGGLSLTFGLASQGQGDRGGDAHEQAGHAAGPGDAAPPNPAVIAGGIVMARTSLIDLSL